MTMHCAACEVSWDDHHVNTCWNCNTPGERGHLKFATIATETQRHTTDHLLRTA